MTFDITTTVQCFLLPDDGQEAQDAILAHMDDPSEIYITAYSFTFAPIVDKILQHFEKGDPVHLYLDFSQSQGAAEKTEVQKLVDAGVEVTIGTSPKGSKYICHTKGFTCLDKSPACWEGSVNFSNTGFLQVNTAMLFQSKEWSDQFVSQFKELRKFAWTSERNKQLMPKPPKGVDA